jgi:hypothetical protein
MIMEAGHRVTTESIFRHRDIGDQDDLRMSYMLIIVFFVEKKLCLFHIYQK